MNSAGGGDRTRTPLAEPGILSHPKCDFLKSAESALEDFVQTDRSSGFHPSAPSLVAGVSPVLAARRPSRVVSRVDHASVSCPLPLLAKCRFRTALPRGCNGYGRREFRLLSFDDFRRELAGDVARRKDGAFTLLVNPTKGTDGQVTADGMFQADAFLRSCK